MKQQDPVTTANAPKSPTRGLAAVIALRPFRGAADLPARPQQEAPVAAAALPAQRRIPRTRRLWGREDGFTMSGTRS